MRRYLTQKTWPVIEKMAKENGFQVWLEVVGDGGPLGIHIEAGEIQQGQQ